MKKTLMMLVALLAMVGSVTAEDKFTVNEGFTLMPGEQKELAINLENPNLAYSAFQFDLKLPDGITVAKNNKGKLLTYLSDRKDEDHTLTVGQQADGSYRFLCYNNYNADFEGTTGPLVYVTLVAAEDLSTGSLTASLTGQKITTATEMSKELADYVFTITVVPVPVVKADDKTKAYGDENPELTYSVSGGEVTGEPVLSTEATVVSPVGDYVITIAGGDIITPHTLQNGMLTITKAMLTINAGTYTKKQGEPMPEWEAVYTGFKNNETRDVLTGGLVFSCEADAATAPGTYPVTVSGVIADNYDIVFEAGQLIITEADPVIVTADDITITYGDDIPALTYTTTGVALEGVPELACTATADSDAGEYDIVVGKGTSTNYNFIGVNGKLAIKKALLTVKADDAIRDYGEENPLFTVSYSGFVKSQTEDVLTTKPTATTTATLNSPAGTYDIIVSGGEATNYEFVYQNGTLTINEVNSINPVILEQEIDVYDLQGNRVCSSAKSLRGLSKGMYILRSKDGKNQKVILK